MIPWWNIIGRIIENIKCNKLRREAFRLSDSTRKRIREEQGDRIMKILLEREDEDVRI